MSARRPAARPEAADRPASRNRPPGLIDDRTFARLCHARDLLGDLGEGRLSIERIAREAAMSRFHFSRCFKASFGQTPHAYRTTLRIERARHLLIVSDRSVTELCMALGFSSVSSFSLLFARHVGMSATVYRRQLRAMAASPRRFPAELVPMCFASRYCPAPR